MKSNKRWLTLAIMCLGVISLYGVPYAIRSYYDVFQTSMGLTNQQLGLLMSMFGIGCMIFYFPGGWLADKYSPLKLIVFSMIATGLLSLSILSFPSFPILMLIYFGFAITTTLTCWGAHVKIIRSLGTDEEQGKMFGAREAFSGAAGALIGFGVLGIVKAVGEGDTFLTFKYLVIAYASISIICGILMPLIMKESEISEESVAVPADMSTIIKVAKNKKVWLIGFVVFASYCAYSALTYLSPYLTDAYGMSVTLGSVWGIMRQYGFRIVMCTAAGLLADKIGSSTKIISIGLVGIIICILGYLIMPVYAGTFSAAIVLMIIWALISVAMRGIYYSQLGESDIPREVTGTAVGIISVIAYSPDAFFYTMVGGWIDKYGLLGYKYMFIFMVSLCILSLIAAGYLYKSNQKSVPEESAVNLEG